MQWEAISNPGRLHMTTSVTLHCKGRQEHTQQPINILCNPPPQKKLPGTIQNHSQDWGHCWWGPPFGGRSCWCGVGKRILEFRHHSSDHQFHLSFDWPCRGLSAGTSYPPILAEVQDDFLRNWSSEYSDVCHHAPVIFHCQAIGPDA